MTVIAFQALNITMFGIIAVLLDVELGTFSLFMQFKCVCIRALIASFFWPRKSPLPPKSEVAPTQPKIPLQASEENVQPFMSNSYN